jgi:hypothetical protein
MSDARRPINLGLALLGGVLLWGAVIAAFMLAFESRLPR